MFIFELVIGLLLVGAVLSLWAARLGVPYPALLALVGRGAGARARRARRSRSTPSWRWRCSSRPRCSTPPSTPRRATCEANLVAGR